MRVFSENTRKILDFMYIIIYIFNRFEEFQRFFDPLDAKYRRFYVGKTDTFPDYCIDFEKLFVFKTQTLIKSLMVRKIENERKNIEIIENSLKIAGENQTKNQTKNKVLYNRYHQQNFFLYRKLI